MTATDVGQLIRYAVLPWLFLLFAVIILKMLRGEINMSGLLSDKPGGAISPERVSSLAGSIFAIGAYAFSVLAIGAPEDPTTGKPTMPDVPASLLVLLASVNGVYLSGKLIRSKKAGE